MFAFYLLVSSLLCIIHTFKSLNLTVTIIVVQLMKWIKDLSGSHLSLLSLGVDLCWEWFIGTGVHPYTPITRKCHSCGGVYSTYGCTYQSNIHVDGFPAEHGIVKRRSALFTSPVSGNVVSDGWILSLRQLHIRVHCLCCTNKSRDSCLVRNRIDSVPCLWQNIWCAKTVSDLWDFSF